MSNAHLFGQQAFAVAAKPLQAVDIPSGIHPALSGTKAFPDGDAPSSLIATERYMADARSSLEAVNTLRQTADPTATEAAHVLRVNQSTELAMAKIGRGYDSARRALDADEQALRAEINNAARLTPTAHAGEIRGIIRAMPEAERYSAILQAIQEGDAATVAAVLDAPGITSGLTEQQRDNLRSMHFKRVAPDQLKRLEAVTQARNRVLESFDAALGLSDVLGARQYAEKIKKAQAEAKHAADSATGDRWQL